MIARSRRWRTVGTQVPGADRGARRGTGADLADRGTAVRRHRIAAARERAILIRDGIIRRVADAAEPCPDGAWPLDVGRRVLMPGLTDAHTHASGMVPQVAKGAEEPLPGTTAHFLQAELRDYDLTIIDGDPLASAHGRTGRPDPG